MGVRLEEMALVLAVLCISLGFGGVEGRRNTLTLERESQVDRMLKLLNKPAMKSIHSEDGDIIDCVDIYKQPAFDHPLLKNHTIQMRPSRDVLSMAGEPSSQTPLPTPPQLWQKSGSCPEGTVPIRRIQKHHLLGASSIENYGKKPYHGIDRREIRTADRTFGIGGPKLHSYAVLLTESYSYTGAQASINLWNPSVEAPDEYSTGQIWLTDGVYDDAGSIEAGWAVNPAVYADNRTRMFIYWTDDGGKKTGCYDIICAGFVQTNHEVALGATFATVSTLKGPQVAATFFVWKDFDHDKWWLAYGANTTLGYWPAPLFMKIYKVATMVEFGGDVYSPRMRSGGPHTATAMGSGRFANEHFGSASFISRPRIMDYSLTLKYPDPAFALSLQSNCYSVDNSARGNSTEDYFYFGGPGRNTACP